ncbi:hypothetical protein T552_02982 [Pneumocystis carinii B80]|uniref:FAS1 domain-containing protein n=1 Tax=Pneumocystis carinii (strain B80) TaxID=1408658 RepID=A0A0W4ZCN8_PNEC8|nr:hypothetical protein T552_02982 [Pneumocystis carinii B80]KTW26087.1 hypothetical protein T552_02982 [Pneumocystis carinii B80]
MSGFVRDQDAKALSLNSGSKKWQYNVIGTSISVIDFLSSSSEFKPLIKELQRKRLINYLNVLENITFIAPGEKAFNNETELTPEILKYHVLDGMLFTEDVIDEYVFRSHMYNYGEKNGVGVKVKKMVDSEGHKKVDIGGVSIVKGDYIIRNGIIQVTDKIMIPPKNMYSILSVDPDMTIFMNLVNHGILKHEKITVFAPTNRAFKSLNDVEYTYLRSRYGISDLKMLILNHLQTNNVIYKCDVIDKIAFKSDANGLLNIVKNGTGFYVNGYKIVQYDIITKNGVIHKIDNLIFPRYLEFTPIKYLYGADTTKFANEILVAGLIDLVNNKTIEQVILAPIDSSFYFDTDMKEIRCVQEIKYHFIYDWFDIDTLEDEKLLTTKMEEKLLGGRNQKIKISRKNGEIWLNDRSMILGKPLVIGKTKIYRIDSELVPPLLLPAMVAPMFHISISMEYLYNTKMDILLRNKESLTYFVPTNSAWEDLGLVQDYLALNSSKDLLKEVLINTIFNEVLHFDELLLINKTIFTLGGASATIQKYPTGFFLISENKSSTFQIEKRDILLKNGVAHAVSKVFIPSTLNITPQHLFSTKHISLFPQTIELSDLFYILNPQEKFTILAPIDSAWKTLKNIVHDNLTLQEIVKLHLLPPQLNNSDFLKDIYPRKSLHKDGIKIGAVKIDGSLYNINFYSSKNCYQQINILGEGKTSFHGQILIIDRVLDPKCLSSTSYTYILQFFFLIMLIFIIFCFLIKKILHKNSLNYITAALNNRFHFYNRHMLYYSRYNNQDSDEGLPILRFNYLPKRSLFGSTLGRTLTV